jgi:hypothetical protein
MNWKGCRRKRSSPNLGYLSSVCLEGLSMTTKTHQDARYAGQDSNQARSGARRMASVWKKWTPDRAGRVGFELADCFSPVSCVHYVSPSNITALHLWIFPPGRHTQFCGTDLLLSDVRPRPFKVPSISHWPARSPVSFSQYLQRCFPAWRRRRQRKRNPVPGGITGPPCS